jgi:hypothetical protein
MYTVVSVVKYVSMFALPIGQAYLRMSLVYCERGQGGQGAAQAGVLSQPSHAHPSTDCSCLQPCKEAKGTGSRQSSALPAAVRYVEVCSHSQD